MKYLSSFLIFLTTISWSRERHHGGYIIGGEIARPGQFPWQGYLHLNFPNGDIYLCGCSLITVEWVLTAAHCIDYDDVEATVVLGSLRRDGLSDSEQEFTSKVFVVHKHWHRNSMSNDIALIRLNRPAKLTRHVQLIELADYSVQPSTKVVASGWGYTENNGPPSMELRYVRLKTAPLTTCQEYFHSPFLRKMVCINGTGTESVCQGDSGGSLIEYQNHIPKHIGISSFVSPEGCTAGPMVFTETSKFINWIHSKIGVPSS